ncbi:hypothetical protein ACFL3J_02160 [Candidatus Omnitrophota bacterium]
MSIITDALKKAQGSSPDVQAPPPRVEKKRPIVSLPPRKKIVPKPAPKDDFLYIPKPEPVKPAHTNEPFHTPASIAAMAIVALIILGLGAFFILEKTSKEASPGPTSANAKAGASSFAYEVGAESPVTAGETSKPATQASEINETIALTGIMYSQKKPLAVINNAILGEGEKIGKFQIRAIEKNSIRISSDDKEFVVKMRQ